MLEVADDCLSLGLRAGAVVFRGVHVTARGAVLTAEIRQTIEAIRTRFAGAGALQSVPAIKGFQAILRQVGIDPRKVQPSVERLLRFALKRGDLPCINSLVDAYNLVSVRRLCSLGAHDLDRIALPVTLRLLTGQETFTPLGRSDAEPVVAGEFGYVDAEGRVLCRLDVQQADGSKVTAATASALLIVEGTAEHPPDVLQTAIAEAIEKVTAACGGTAEIVTLPG